MGAEWTGLAVYAAFGAVTGIALRLVDQRAWGPRLQGWAIGVMSAPVIDVAVRAFS